MAEAASSPQAIGVVVIGRNEGERLRLSLESLRHVPHRVYVDSGSTDGSPQLAQQMGFELVQLGVPPKFTAARARNAGLERLLDLCPSLHLVQMVDGDCEVAPRWIGEAAAALAADPKLAAVFGRRRERFPAGSMYNMMCDDEWNVPVGEARSCGGDALFRVEALRQTGGYADELIAGEEPDLCLRMRSRGWRIRRIDADMTVHDAALHRFGQWWLRARRGGHAFAELAHRHGRNADPHWRRQVASISFWSGTLFLGVFLALAGLAFGAPLLASAGAASIVLFAGQASRLFMVRWRRGHPLREAAAWAALLMIGKIAQLQGIIQFHATRGDSGKRRLIEYKS